MSRHEEPRITDPQRLRALAHPLRAELLDVLRIEGQATATRCAELTGESVASCSFHLRMLAKYGYIEPAEQQGREKPWRLAIHSFTATADFEDQASIYALREVATLAIDQAAQRVREWLARGPEEPLEWIQASTISTSVFWATAEELAEVSQALSELTDRFKARNADPSLRPAGARVARLLGAITVDPERPDSSHGDHGDQGASS
ncbi:ArsR/SmtB family transcription factor [Phytoactinopolyspora mesophila]|uniref:Helix-turn-helix domain-containing protein n=1 Tax=Phytoactinopolyspora mesophila TaxID=2650750 RepID=A0A7K3M834_9ACTN|nr:winged helix-turn-helix domain-containing protein [Phytoactinopolyspora mesophila]NDL59350.1 helix-turn-helix domain-containing protein [Phytoactinopolyspora mesophila]